MKDITYNMLKNGLDASSMRQKAISSNIANVNTVGYKSNKVVFESELRKALGKNGHAMSKTNALHIGGADQNAKGKVIRQTNTSVDETGNNVDMDTEMVDLAANEIYYSALIQDINRKLGSMSYVINR